MQIRCACCGTPIITGTFDAEDICIQCDGDLLRIVKSQEYLY